MAPTRELAKQVCDNFSAIADGPVCISIYGGTSYERQGITMHCHLYDV